MSGIYLIILEVLKPCSQKIGALGEMRFEKGIYIYVGSAQKNMKNRINRHLRKEKKIKWHIDYLSTHEKVMMRGALIKENAKKEEECLIAEKLKKYTKVIPKFGSSDCKCEGHFFCVNDWGGLENEVLKEFEKYTQGSQNSNSKKSPKIPYEPDTESLMFFERF